MQYFIQYSTTQVYLISPRTMIRRRKKQLCLESPGKQGKIQKGYETETVTEKVHQKVLQLNLNENCTYSRESLVKLEKVVYLTLLATAAMNQYSSLDPRFY